jgi:hypothetical protein
MNIFKIDPIHNSFIKKMKNNLNNFIYLDQKNIDFRKSPEKIFSLEFLVYFAVVFIEKKDFLSFSFLNKVYKFINFGLFSFNIYNKISLFFFLTDNQENSEKFYELPSIIEQILYFIVMLIDSLMNNMFNSIFNDSIQDKEFLEYLYDYKKEDENDFYMDDYTETFSSFSHLKEESYNDKAKEFLLPIIALKTYSQNEKKNNNINIVKNKYEKIINISNYKFIKRAFSNLNSFHKFCLYQLNIFYKIRNLKKNINHKITKINNNINQKLKQSLLMSRVFVNDVLLTKELYQKLLLILKTVEKETLKNPLKKNFPVILFVGESHTGKNFITKLVKNIFLYKGQTQYQESFFIMFNGSFLSIDGKNFKGQTSLLNIENSFKTSLKDQNIFLILKNNDKINDLNEKKNVLSSILVEKEFLHYKKHFNKFPIIETRIDNSNDTDKHFVINFNDNIIGFKPKLNFCLMKNFSNISPLWCLKISQYGESLCIKNNININNVSFYLAELCTKDIKALMEKDNKVTGPTLNEFKNSIKKTIEKHVSH